ncbi:M2 family metallopeptidase [Oleisolibacter albus]|uniref:M2 family metallopeptidase n=1 Tax=Oleisolibacter albus TaxID=2171757 RepID=UPI000DF3768F|nr:M2 family metallopeptidase [Oleisolibacter albus]
MSISRLTRLHRAGVAAGALLLLAACDQPASADKAAAAPPPASAQQKGATVEDAVRFVERAEAQLAEAREHSGRLAWVMNTYITPDTLKLSSEAGAAYSALVAKLTAESKQFVGLDLPADVARKLSLLRNETALPSPADAALNKELAELDAKLGELYATGKVCRDDGSDCKTLDEIDDIFRSSRDEKELRRLWTGWHTVAQPMRPLYQREAEIANIGAKELGLTDTGALWRSGYDMKPEEFEAETDRLWEQVKPLYTALHCYARTKLGEKYGTDVVPQDKPIPAHLLGNMWAQEWGNIYDIVAPKQATRNVDVTALLTKAGYDPIKMTKSAEGFFTGLGFASMPQTFWDRSMLTRPKDREVVCHASAWDIDDKDDIRIKMCMRVNGDDFQTIHHEMGHNIYQRAYKAQSTLFRNGANDGFHEAIGDFIALSVTPGYLVKLGLLDKEPSTDGDIGLLLQQAMDKVAFMPFGLLIDKWRWDVFSGKTKPEDYNKAWWDLRVKYQGVAAPVERTEADFDPGAKNHVATSVPYVRYFLARILQFQFHQAACQQAGYTGPLHRCSIAGNTEVGKRFNAMLEMGASKPWPEALKTFTGSDKMDAGAMLAYFAPLKDWLDKQNEGKSCGW